MSHEKILIIEDNADVVELLKYNLEKEGFTTISALSGDSGLKLANSDSPSLILLDLMLPEIDGLEICRILKNDTKTQSIPIVILSAKGEESDIITGLELGADDYITKPFSPKVLIARIRAAFRRKKQQTSENTERIVIGDLTIDSERFEVKIDERQIDLTAAEFRLLRFLAGKPGRVFSRYQIVDAIKGADYPVTERSVDVQIVGLRKKLGEAGKLIETVRGIGYRFRNIYDE